VGRWVKQFMNTERSLRYETMGRKGRNRGFSVIELLVVISIACVMAAIAIPQFINATRTYQLSAAVATASGAIQSTRFQAIMRGYPYQLVLTPSTLSYQVYNEPPGTSSFTAVGSAIPIASKSNVTLSASRTFTFKSNGTVTEASNNMSFQLTSSTGRSNTITVSGVGNVAVTSP
jgi:type IV fimbrial biogenesis protein FimT